MEFLSISYYPYYILSGIPVFFLVKWLFRKKQQGLQKNILTIIVAIILTSVIFFILFWTIDILYEPSRQFSSLQWKTNKMERYRMLDNLIQKKKLIGKDTIELKQILGNEFIRRTNQSWEFDAGSGGGGLGFRFHILTITISGDKVIKADHFYWED
jgi:nitrogen fixation-related uncharacterized protein